MPTRLEARIAEIPLPPAAIPPRQVSPTATSPAGGDTVSWSALFSNSNPKPPLTGLSIFKLPDPKDGRRTRSSGGHNLLSIPSRFSSPSLTINSPLLELGGFLVMGQKPHLEVFARNGICDFFNPLEFRWHIYFGLLPLFSNFT